MHHYNHNIGDYRRDTVHLSLLEHGIYRQLLDEYYLKEEPIKTQSVMRRLRIVTDEEKEALSNVLEDFFERSECGEYWTKGRCDRVIEDYHLKSDTARENGKKGGRPPKNQGDFEGVGEPNETKPVNSGNPEKTGSKANQEPLTNNHKPKTSNQEPSKKTKQKKFVKPTVDEVRAYCQERGNSIDPESFVNNYESKGWMIGKSPMKCWQSAVRTWEKNPYSTKETPSFKRLSDDELLAECAKLKISTAGFSRYELIAKLEAKA